MKLKDLKMVFFDFDGVFTDNRVWTDSSGREMVCCSRSDGMGLSLLRKLGIPMMILSSEKNPVVRMRARKMKIDCIHGMKSKSQTMQCVCRQKKINLNEVAFVGNDDNDLLCMEKVGLPVAVADAYPQVKRKAKWVLRTKGGLGAVREFCEKVYRAKKGTIT
ncbi:HAD hydrolase family protein [Omnitrophica bacterium]|nr:HAD hydrolase family protein [Candidatus Omnitrophota bacterium]